MKEIFAENHFYLNLKRCLPECFQKLNSHGNNFLVAEPLIQS